MANDRRVLRDMIGEIAALPMADGVAFDTASTSAAVIREGAEYEGIRLSLTAGLGGAKLKLRLDLSFGDPVEPSSAPTAVVAVADGRAVEIQVLHPDLGVEEPLSIAADRHGLDAEALIAAAHAALAAPDRAVGVDLAARPRPDRVATGRSQEAQSPGRIAPSREP